MLKEIWYRSLGGAIAGSGEKLRRCDVYGALLGAYGGTRRTRTGGDWRLGTNRVVVVVKDPEWTARNRVMCVCVFVLHRISVSCERDDENGGKSD